MPAVAITAVIPEQLSQQELIPDQDHDQLQQFLKCMWISSFAKECEFYTGQGQNALHGRTSVTARFRIITEGQRKLWFFVSARRVGVFYTVVAGQLGGAQCLQLHLDRMGARSTREKHLSLEPLYALTRGRAR